MTTALKSLHVGVIFLISLSASCVMVKPADRQAVLLPKFPVTGVRFDDGITKDEAVAVASVYFCRFVCGCGMPDEPQDGGAFWQCQLLGGYAGSDYGTLRIAKDGSEIFLYPPKGGFKESTKSLLQK